MATFLFALLAAFVAGIGARDQMVVASLAARRGSGAGLLVVSLVTAGASAAFAGWAGGQVAPQLIPGARHILVAMALGLAALELIALRPRKSASEPTESLGALAVVLLAHEITDAPRLLVFALAAASAEPQFPMFGGIVGCSAGVVLAWGAGESLLGLTLARIRLALGIGLALIALWLAT